MDDAKVQEAIRKGVDWLKKAPSPGSAKTGVRNADELILLTLIHAGVPENDPKLQELLRKILEAPLDRTYTAALQAVVLEELDRVGFQLRIAQCGQFLIDNQCLNGQWDYGQPSPAANAAPTERRGTASGAVRASRVKPKVQRRVAIARTKTGAATGDNSNSQYAALGLRACHDSGVVVPKETLYLAVKALREGQRPKGDCKGAIPTGLPRGSVPRGWCYCSPGGHKAYASMTAGSAAALVIYDYILQRDWKKNAAVRDGLAWLAANFSVTEHRGPMEWTPIEPTNELYYALYAMERLGLLYGTEKFGPHFWYAEGARALLASQRNDGSWTEVPEDKSWSTPTWDTCFAILFLRRATHPLVPSVDRFHAPK